MHSFEQNFADLTITITDIKNNPKISLKDKKLMVKCGDDIILDKILMYSVDQDQIVWYFENNNLVIELVKEIHQWWECCFVGDEKIDTEELAKKRPITLNHMKKNEQKMIEKLLNDQNERRTKDIQKSKNIE